VTTVAGVQPGRLGTAIAAAGSPWSRSAGLARLSEAFAEAAGRLGSVGRTYAIAGRIVRIEAAGSPVLAVVDPALAHLASEDTGPPDLLVQLWDSASSGVAVPRSPLQEEADAGDAIRSAYHAVPRILSVYDQVERRAVVWVPDASGVPSNELASPLRTLIHWWSRDRRLQFVHGGAVALNGRAALLAGPSGAGKSTAAIACLLAGLDYLGDDYVLVGDEAQPVVHSLYSAGKVQPAHLEKFPELRPLVEKGHELPAEKPLWFFNRHFPDRMVSSARAVGVLVPEVTGESATTIVPMRRAAALAALAPSTIVQLSGADQRSLSAIGAFLGRVPSFRLRSGTELPALARAVRRFIEDAPVVTG
jgi:hypothetical protein